MTGFHVVDLTPQCEVQLRGHYRYELLEQLEGAPDLIAGFSAEIWRAPEHFEVPLEGTVSPLTFRWVASAETAGIASVRDPQKPLSISLLASGLDSESDRITLEAFQKFAVQKLRDTGFEPAFDLLELTDRPLLATVGLFIPDGELDRGVFALADRCFAAAYFRKLGLA